MEVRHDGYISGTVLVEGLPAPYAVVRLYYRPTGTLLYSTRCDAGGNFSFTRLADLQSENHYVVALDPEGGYSYNAKIFDKLKPVSTAPWQVRPLSMCGGYCGSLSAYVIASGLSGVNSLEGLSSSVFAAIGSNAGWYPGFLNNGTLLSISNPTAEYAWRTLTNSQAANNGSGVEITFPTAKSIGRFSISCFPSTTINGNVCILDFVIEVFYQGNWLEVGRVANGLVQDDGNGNYSLQSLPCNPNGLYSSTRWRIYIANFSASNQANFYAGELKAYEWSIALDPHWASVITLVRFDGANGSTALTCEKGGTYTPNGDVSVAAASARYGAGGGKFTGADGYNRWTLTSNPSPDTYFGAEFTIEAMVRFSAVGARSIPFSLNSGGVQTLAIRLEASNVMTLLGASNASYAGAVGTTPIAANTWYHMAVTRVADGTVRLFVDGILQSSMQDASNKVIASSTLGGCNAYYGTIWNMNGDIDEFRVTNNVARYVANFTPPTDRFPAA